MAQNNKRLRQVAVQEFKKSLDQLQERLQGTELHEQQESDSAPGLALSHGQESGTMAANQPLDPHVLEAAAKDIEQYMQETQSICGGSLPDLNDESNSPG